MSIVTFSLLAAMNCIKCNPVDPSANGHSNGQQASENSLIMDNLRRYLNQMDQETQNSGIMRFGRSDRSQPRHGSASDEWASQDSASDEWASQDSASQDSASQDSASQDSASQDSASQDSASQDSASQDSASQDSAFQDFESIRKDASHNLGIKSRMERSEKASYSSVIVPNDGKMFSEVGGQSLGQFSSGRFVKRDDLVLNGSINPVSYDLYDRIMFLKSLMRKQQVGMKPMKPALFSSTHVRAM